MRERRKFSREFKIEAIKPIIEGRKSLAQVSRELEIKRSLLQRWRQQYQLGPEQAFPGSGHLSPEDAEVARIKRENRRLQMENEILKKALAIFSKDPQ